ncbi:MAG: hypothetical protein QNJ51_28230 [Calothrix sp. MO_167.B12]|nr:hypothetical protein [Calothrix sp. MO_167.B12]
MEFKNYVGLRYAPPNLQSLQSLQSHFFTKRFAGKYATYIHTPPDFDPDGARWEALKEKHNL